MKTTIEIADDLFARSRKLADRQGITLRALVEEGLRLALKAHARGEASEFSLPTFGRGGLTPHYADAGLHRAILDSYSPAPAESLDPSSSPAVHEGDPRS